MEGQIHAIVIDFDGDVPSTTVDAITFSHAGVEVSAVIVSKEENASQERSIATPVRGLVKANVFVAHDGRIVLNSADAIVTGEARASTSHRIGVFIVTMTGNGLCGFESAPANCASPPSLATVQTIFYSGVRNLVDFYAKVTRGNQQVIVGANDIYSVTIPAVTDMQNVPGAVQLALGANFPATVYQHKCFILPPNFNRGTVFSTVGTRGVAHMPGPYSWLIRADFPTLAVMHCDIQL